MLYIEEAIVLASLAKVMEGFGTLIMIIREKHRVVNGGDLITLIMIVVGLITRPLNKESVQQCSHLKKERNLREIARERLYERSCCGCFAWIDRVIIG